MNDCPNKYTQVPYNLDTFKKRNVCFLKDCIDNIGKYIAQGTYGMVYEYSENDIIIALKLIRIGKETNILFREKSVGDFKQEVSLAKQVGDLGIGPIVYGDKVCKGIFSDEEGDFMFGFLFQQKLGKTVAEYLTSIKAMKDDKVPKELRRKMLSSLANGITELQELTEEYDISNPDLNMNNVMVDTDDKGLVTKAYMIDCEVCKFKSTYEEIESMWNRSEWKNLPQTIAFLVR